MGSWFAASWDRNNFPDNWCVLLWFKGWSIDTQAKYFFALLGIFLLAVFNEALGLHREQRSRKYQKSSFTVQLEMTLLYGVQMVVAYLLMLVVMTYELLMFMALVFGLMVGKACFRPWTPHTDYDYVSMPGRDKETLKVQVSSHTPCCAPR